MKILVGKRQARVSIGAVSENTEPGVGFIWPRVGYELGLEVLKD
jgi:hypothetical protein